jgi:hypothetical protein
MVRTASRREARSAMVITNLVIALWKAFYFTWEVPRAETPWFVMFQFALFFVLDTFLPEVYNFCFLL